MDTRKLHTEIEAGTSEAEMREQQQAQSRQHGARCALVEGPMWADAEYYGTWLLAAAKAKNLWGDVIDDPTLKWADRLRRTDIGQFEEAATVLLLRLKKYRVSFLVKLHRLYEAEDFALMIGMGFCVLTGHRYQMVIPAQLTSAIVQKAALELLETEDEHSDLHPENIITTLTYVQAIGLQNELRATGPDNRLNHRLELLDAVKTATPTPLQLNWRAEVE